jgi:hypothetical protein
VVSCRRRLPKKENCRTRQFAEICYFHNGQH